jgi:hypothetical protein
LPYAWLYAVVPGFKALRAPARFDALAMLSLAVLAGYGVASLRRGSGQSWKAAVLVGLVVLESLVWPAARAEPVPVGDGVPPVYRWLAEQGVEEGGEQRPVRQDPILELPMAFTPGGPQLDYQYLSTYHWRTTPDGYSGFIPPKHGQIVYEMERFPSERSVSLLQALGVRQVVIHSDRYPPDRWLDMQEALAQAGDLEPVETFGADLVYQVRPRAFDPGELEVSGYVPPRAAAGEPYTAYAIAINHGPRSYAVQPTDQIQPAFLWGGSENRPGGDAPADLPLVTSPTGGAAVIAIPLEAPAVPGVYRLSLGEEGGPLGTWSAAGTVEVGAQGDDAFPVPARLEDWDLPESAHPGEPLTVDLTWRALGKIDAYYSVYVKLLDAGGNAVASWDGQPRDDAAPTLLWVPGEMVEDRVTLGIPAGAAPGDYLVEVGMYRAADLARCLTLNDDGVPVDRVVLGAVRVEP